MTMAKRILVPLDGDVDSERVVPVVAAMARQAGATVRLLRVFPVPEIVRRTGGHTVAYADQEMARLTAETEDDLVSVDDALDGVPVEHAVRFGDTVEEILTEAEAFDADLIALATPRRRGLARRLRGGVADRVVRRATVPTLVLRA